MGEKYVGAVVRRREDPRYLTGRGRFVDDMTVPGCLHAALLRSPHAHARIAAIRLAAARARPGVVAVLTFGEDSRSALRSSIRSPGPRPAMSASPSS